MWFCSAMVLLQLTNISALPMDPARGGKTVAKEWDLDTVPAELATCGESVLPMTLLLGGGIPACARSVVEFVRLLRIMVSAKGVHENVLIWVTGPFDGNAE